MALHLRAVMSFSILWKQSNNSITDLEREQDLLARSLGSSALPKISHVSLSLSLVQCGIGEDGLIALLVSALEIPSNMPYNMVETQLH
jgi:hypothetical protein